MLTFFKKLFGISSKHTFFDEFLENIEKNKVQLEIHHNNRVLLTIDSLKNVPIWLERGKVAAGKYKNGFVLFFFLPKKNIEKNPIYINYKSTLDSKFIENKDKSVIYFMKFFNKTITAVELEGNSKKLLSNIYKLPTKSKIDIILRYLKN